MSDVPAAAAWTVTLWCVTAGTIGSTIAGGLAATIAILIRPNLAPMASIPLLWFLLEGGKRSGRHRYFRQALGFSITLLPGVVITAALNQLWNGSPWISGYGAFADIFSYGNILPNVRRYVVWLSETQTPLALLGIAALLMPARWLWRSDAGRSMVLVLGLFVIAVWAEYCAYFTFGAWWDLRFLLPTFGFMMVGVAAVLLLAIRDEPRTDRARVRRRLIIVALTFGIALLGVRGVHFAIRERAFEQQYWEAKYPGVAAIIALRTEPNAVIVSGLHSGSVRYYAGRTTLTYFNLDPDWLDPAVSWLNTHGAHPYALLEDAEVKEFKSRFSSKNSAGRLDMRPSSVFYDDPSKIYLFDLLRTSESTEPVETITDRSPAVRCFVPAPPASLTFQSGAAR